MSKYKYMLTHSWKYDACLFFSFSLIHVIRKPWIIIRLLLHTNKKKIHYFHAVSIIIISYKQRFTIPVFDPFNRIYENQTTCRTYKLLLVVDACVFATCPIKFIGIITSLPFMAIKSECEWNRIDRIWRIINTNNIYKSKHCELCY